VQRRPTTDETSKTGKTGSEIDYTTPAPPPARFIPSVGHHPHAHHPMHHHYAGRLPAPYTPTRLAHEQRVQQEYTDILLPGSPRRSHFTPTGRTLIHAVAAGSPRPPSTREGDKLVFRLPHTDDLPTTRSPRLTVKETAGEGQSPRTLVSPCLLVSAAHSPSAGQRARAPWPERPEELEVFAASDTSFLPAISNPGTPLGVDAPTHLSRALARALSCCLDLCL
jgi:hypothetical protein